MITSRIEVLASVNYYAGLVSSAKSSCEDARPLMVEAMAMVDQNWQGHSGGAMETALVQLKEELDGLYSQMEIVEQSMRSRGNYICNTWPEERQEADIDGGDGAFGGGGGGGR